MYNSDIIKILDHKINFFHCEYYINSWLLNKQCNHKVIYKERRWPPNPLPSLSFFHLYYSKFWKMEKIAWMFQILKISKHFLFALCAFIIRGIQFLLLVFVVQGPYIPHKNINLMIFWKSFFLLLRHFIVFFSKGTSVTFMIFFLRQKVHKFRSKNLF